MWLYVVSRVRGLSLEPGCPRRTVGLPLSQWSGGKALLASSSAWLLQAIPRAGSSDTEEPWGVRAVIQLFAAGDSAHAGVVPYVACELTQVVRNLPRAENPQSGGDWIVAGFQYQ